LPSPYEKEGVPVWTAVLSFSLVFVTVAVPTLFRRRQVAKNSRRPTPDMQDNMDEK
jgi:hypothetical protein